MKGVRHCSKHHILTYASCVWIMFKSNYYSLVDNIKENPIKLTSNLPTFQEEWKIVQTTHLLLLLLHGLFIMVAQ